MALGRFPATFGLSLFLPTKPIASSGFAMGMCDMISNEFPVGFPFSCPPNLTIVGLFFCCFVQITLA